MVRQCSARVTLGLRLLGLGVPQSMNVFHSIDFKVCVKLRLSKSCVLYMQVICNAS